MIRAAVFAHIMAAIRGVCPRARFFVHTDGPTAPLAAELGGYNDTTVSGANFPMLHAMHEMVAADVLVMSVSSVSYTAALLSEGLVMNPGGARGRVNTEALGWRTKVEDALPDLDAKCRSDPGVVY